MLRRLARPLLGATFVAAGIDAIRDHEERVRRARALGVPDPDTAARAVAGAQVGAGALLALGRMPRLTSLLLAATVVPDAATGHAFWSQSDKQRRDVERGLFVRDLGLLGGLLVSVGDSGRASRRAARAAGAAKASAKGTARAASGRARRATKSAAKRARKSAKRLS